MSNVNGARDEESHITTITSIKFTNFIANLYVVEEFPLMRFPLCC